MHATSPTLWMLTTDMLRRFGDGLSAGLDMLDKARRSAALCEPGTPIDVDRIRRIWDCD